MPGSLRRRDWLTAIAVASLAIIFLASAIAYRVSSRPDRDVWAIVFAMASAVMLGLVTARKLVGTQPVDSELDVRFLLIGATLTIGEFGLAITEGITKALGSDCLDSRWG
jgi:hypothetical protein